MIDALLVAAAFALTSTLLVPTFGLASPLYIFTAMQTLMAVGTLAALNPSIPADATYRHLILITILTLYGWGAVAAFGRSSYVRRHPSKSLSSGFNTLIVKPDKIIWSGILFSVAISLLYFAQVGGMTFLYGLQAAFTGQGDATDIATMRLSAYSGDRYFAPGYVNQFKNSLLPALVAVVLTYRLRQDTRSWLVDGGLILLTTLLLLGTGQRGAFVIVVVIVLVYIYWISGRQAIGRMLATAAVGIALFSIASVATLRQSGSGQSFIAQSFAEIWKRGMEDQQGSAINGFRYIYSLPITNGREWLDGIGGLLPGPGGSSLASEIFETVYGSTRGTMPPSLWGSIYHNFGFIGAVVAVPILVGILVWISEFVVREGARNTIEIVGFAGVTACFGMWAAGDPMFLFNSGIVVYAGLWYFGRLVRIRGTNESSHDATSTPFQPQTQN